MSFFLIPQLITSMIEAAVNKLSALDPTFDQRCQPLLGKKLLIDIAEAKVPLTFVVCQNKIAVLSDAKETNDCAVKTSLAALKDLKDPNQITRLIKEDQLTLTGDLLVAQQFSQLIKETDIDWEDHLSYYIGDGLAHTVASRFKHFATVLESKQQDFERIITEFAQDEGKITPHPIEMADHSAKVNQTRAKVDKLAARVETAVSAAKASRAAKIAQRKR